MDPATGSVEFQFAQPVSIDRPVPVKIVPWYQPHGEQTRIIAGFRKDEIMATCVDGRVRVRWGDSEDTEVVDLA